MESEDEELCLIDAGIESMLNVPVHRRLSVINLHANQISRIQNLHSAHNLRHLDLSSNAIARIDGLERLLNLRTLNLSCNRIQRVEGLEELCALVKCNLSYNRISRVDGFTAMRGSAYRLSHVELHGNALESTSHLVKCFAGCTNLRRLTLAQGRSSNALCQRIGYEGDIFNGLPQLQVLNGCDRTGLEVAQNDIVADIPGLDQFADFLFSSASESNVVTVATPRIDAMLEAFKRQSVSSPLTTSHSDNDAGRKNISTMTIDGSSKKKASTEQSHSAYDKRLQFLENQISNLLDNRDSRVELSESVHNDERDATGNLQAINKPSSDGRNFGHLTKRDVDATDESDVDSSSPALRQNPTKNSKLKSDSQISNNDAGFSLAARKREKKPVDEFNSKNLRNRDANKTFGFTANRKSSPKPRGAPQTVARRELNNGQPPAKGLRTDEARRDDLETTYVSILQQLDEEKERRWKAEQAVKKLAEKLQHVLAKSKDDEEMQKASYDSVAHAKQSLMDERESRLNLQTERDVVAKQRDELMEKLEAETAITSELRKALRAKEEAASSMEQEHLKQESVLGRKTQESQLKAAALGREVDLLKSQIVNVKGQLQQMQELLANREQEHRRELDGRFSIGSKEFQEQLAKELAKHEKDHQRERRRLREETESIAKKYDELEDEFRSALYSEADRFKQLQAAFEKVSEDNARNLAALAVAQQKDAKSSKLVAELTSVAKEQKGRIAELSRSKQEQIGELKERIQQLEVHLDEARHRMVTLEMLKQEKQKLNAQITAQESLIEGMKAEKRLWGDELAQQSSSLAQDRGRLEAKIETLQSELVSAKRALDRETDAVRIKTKVIEDQNETVRKLKDGLVERDAQIKEAREECLANQRVVEEQLASEMEENKKIVERLSREQTRKDELKADATDLRRELEEANKTITHLNNRLKVYATLESQVQQMKTTWEQNERKLTDERDRAVETSAAAVNKLRAIDDAFRKQLDAKESCHQSELGELAARKQTEVDAAMARVAEVENEMRQLLRETENSRRTTEDRVRKLTRAFSELQQDIIT